MKEMNAARSFGEFVCTEIMTFLYFHGGTKRQPKNTTIEPLETFYFTWVPLDHTHQLKNYANIYNLSDIRTILKHNRPYAKNVSYKQPRF